MDDPRQRIAKSISGTGARRKIGNGSSRELSAGRGSIRRAAKAALDISRKNPGRRFPSQKDERFAGDSLFPNLVPRFTLETPARVFAIGSCFARTIELALADYEVEIPTSEFGVPKSEWPHRPNGILNEYNPGTMSQRLTAAVEGAKDPEDTIIEVKDGYLDLLLPPGTSAVTYDRAVARRAEIDEVYTKLTGSDLIVITLGFVEAWFDEESGFFLNQMPPMTEVRANPERYTFRRLSAEEAYELLDLGVSALINSGVSKVLVTVSPVPIGRTFTENDVIIANNYSKSVLRICAEMLKDEHPEVDYLPSYEMVMSGGLALYNEDNIHVKPEFVKRVTGYMISNYFPASGSRSETDVDPKPAAGA